MAQSQPKIRYRNLVSGTIYPDTFYDLYSTPENIVREVDHNMDVDGEADWRVLMDKPRPGIELQHRSRGEDNFEPVARFDSLVSEAPVEDTGRVEAFDAYLAPWATDTSGGPSNFHGNAGGDSNPRSAADEGEVDGMYEEALAAFTAGLPTSHVE